MNNKPKVPAYFITSTGTDVGKTFVTTALCWHFRRIGHNVQAIKPVITGWNSATEGESDTVKIIQSLECTVSEQSIARVSPWRFEAPRAPNVAADMSGAHLDYEEILRFCRKSSQKLDCYTFIEGVGGVMSPITENKSCLELIHDLGIDVVLVIGSYLGSISHTLTAMKVLQGLRIHVILSKKEEENPCARDVVEYVNQYYNCTVYIQEHVSRNLRAPWTHTSPEIAHFLLR
ncbi:dethiobiotin synthase [Anaplasma phagocytophilum]|uniref:dethiobiotin synthase n=1 Tax=Anaplasma phagocytophilum TaxID=948 RepID=UPI001E32433E|nr:dethiobiotin synthase [Anaplasma phagocytophilum]